MMQVAMRALRCGLSLLLGLIVSQSLGTDSLVGSRVFIKEGATATAAEGDKEHKPLDYSTGHWVLEEDTDRVRLRNGWVKKSETMALREAKAHFQKQVESVPTLASAWFALGQAGIETRDYGESVKALDEAIRLEGETASNLAQRGIAKLGARDLAGAGRDFEKSLAIDPNEIHAHFGVANFKMAQRDHQGALAAMDHAISVEKSEGFLFSYRGQVKHLLGDQLGALEDLDEAIRLEPFMASTFRDRASLNMHMKKFKEALDDINQSISLEPTNALAWGMRGVVKRHLNDNKGAMQAFDHALVLDPRNSYSLRSRGMLKMGMRDGKGAIKDYDALFANSTPDAQCYFERSNVHFLNQNLELALDDMQAALKLHPENLTYLMGQGILEVESGQYEAGIKNLDSVLEKDAKLYPARLYRGMARVKLLDLEGAIKDLDEAASLNSRDFRPLFHRGFAKLEQGDNQGALVDLNQAERAAPGNLEIKKAIARAETNENKLDNFGFHFAFDLKISSDDNGEIKTLLTKAASQLFLHQYAWAEENFDKAIQLEPGNLLALSGKSAVQFAQKKYDAVVISQNEILRLYPTHLNQIQNRAIARILVKDFEGAVADLNQVLTKRTKSAPTFTKRGYAKLCLKDYSGALADLDEAIRLDGDYLESIYVKAILLAGCEDAGVQSVALAKQLFEQAKAKSPENSYSQTANACLLAIEGKYEEAITLQEKAMQDKKFMDDPRILGGGYAQERIAAWKEKKLWTLH